MPWPFPAAILIAALAAAPSARAADEKVDALIDRSVRELDERLQIIDRMREVQQRGLPPDATRGISPSPPPEALPPAEVRFWVHLRADAQRPIAAEAAEALRAAPGVDLREQPVQVVGAGPSRSQLRFFKPADREVAATVATALAPVLPGLEVVDMTAQYGGVGWLSPGHFELWLAPDAGAR